MTLKVNCADDLTLKRLSIDTHAKRPSSYLPPRPLIRTPWGRSSSRDLALLTWGFPLFPYPWPLPTLFLAVKRTSLARRAANQIPTFAKYFVQLLSVFWMMMMQVKCLKIKYPKAFSSLSSFRCQLRICSCPYRSYHQWFKCRQVWGDLRPHWWNRRKRTTLQILALRK